MYLNFLLDYKFLCSLVSPSLHFFFFEKTGSYITAFSQVGFCWLHPYGGVQHNHLSLEFSIVPNFI